MPGTWRMPHVETFNTTIDSTELKCKCKRHEARSGLYTYGSPECMALLALAYTLRSSLFELQWPASTRIRV
jgi:hypothetical protein